MIKKPKSGPGAGKNHTNRPHVRQWKEIAVKSWHRQQLFRKHGSTREEILAIAAEYKKQHNIV